MIIFILFLAVAITFGVVGVVRADRGSPRRHRGSDGASWGSSDSGGWYGGGWSGGDGGGGGGCDSSGGGGGGGDGGGGGS